MQENTKENNKLMKAIYTDLLGNETTVTFDDLEVELLDKCDHSIFYKCTGYDSLGRQYEATVEKCCDEYLEITDIEMLSYMWHNKKPHQARLRLKAIRFWQDESVGGYACRIVARHL